ncbi:MAG: hemolysin family protein [Vicinamibacterales bacterium]
MLAEIGLLVGLFVLNGLFAMSEIAIVSARRARLQQMAEEGSAGARRALELAAEPTRFLSSVQVGITCIGILSGAVGEASIAEPIRLALSQFPVLEPHAETLSLVVMVFSLTFVSLIVGELVPKRLAMAHPEALAAIVAPPMRIVGAVGRPVVHALSATTDAILRLFRVRIGARAGVTVDEIRLMLQQGADEGVVDASEHALVRNVLDLDDRMAASVITHRADVVFLDLGDERDEVRRKLREAPHTAVPLCDGGLDQVLGIVRTARVLDSMLDGSLPDLRSLAEPAPIVPETTSLMTLLDQFKRTHLPIALVVDEFGGIEGLVSLSDVTAAITGARPDRVNDEPLIVMREDGSLLVDGGLAIDALEAALGEVELLPEDERGRCHTLGGLAMLDLRRLPRTGDVFTRAGHRFEVLDMDGTRVDRLLVSPAPPAEA